MVAVTRRLLSLLPGLALVACGGSAANPTQAARPVVEPEVQARLQARLEPRRHLRPRPRLSVPTQTATAAPEGAAPDLHRPAASRRPGRTPVGPQAPTVGPDPARCAAPLPRDLPQVTYVCDCQAGADPDCVAGSDTQPGTAAAPLRTFSAAIAAFSQLGPGGGVALCRGGAWRSGETRVRRPTCTAAQPCALADYAPAWGSGDEANPVVVGEGAGAYRLLQFDAGQPVPVGGFELRNLTLRGASDAGTGIFFYRVVHDVRMSCLDVSGFDVGVQVASAGARVVLEDAFIHDNDTQGWLGGCEDCGIRRSRFDNNGFGWAAEGRGSLAHNVYFSAGGWPAVSAGMFIERSHLTRSAVDPATGLCQGVSVTMHGGRITGARVVGNLIEEPAAAPGCWGISVDSASSGADANLDLLVSGNVVRDVGNVGIGVNACQGCVVENNVVVQSRLPGTRAIAFPVRARDAADLPGDAFTARNNTVYFSGAGTGVGVAVGGEGAGHVVSNNVVAFSGPVGDCVALDLPASAYAGVAANLCHGGRPVAGTPGVAQGTLQADPLFRAAPDDLRLGLSSPARSSGAALDTPETDLCGCPRGAHPHRGAYED